MELYPGATSSRSFLPLGVAIMAIGLAACAPAAPPSPTAAQAKPAATTALPKVEATAAKPAATAAPAAKAVEAPVGKPATSPVPKAEAKPAASPAAKAEAKPSDWQAEWESTLAAAKREGTVTVFAPPGTPYRTALTTFTRAYPDIKLELSQGSGPEFAPKILAERRAGQFLWDVYVGAASTAYEALRPNGVLDDVRPALIRPETYDNTKWLKGFDAGWEDVNKRHIYAFVAINQWTLWINHQAIPEGQIKTLDDILKPEYKGKIAMNDPRPQGAGRRVISTLLVARNEDWVKRVLADQEMAVTRDGRQLTEWLVRARYPIAIAMSPDTLELFRGEGVNIDHVKPLKGTDPGLTGYVHGFSALNRITNPPHPNAQKVFMNWLMGPEAQGVYGKETRYNSRRTDVPVAYPEYAVDPNVQYLDLQHEVNDKYRIQAEEISKTHLK